MEILNDKVALITGGTKGIGYSVALSMMDQGMKVAITGRTQKGVDQAIENLKKEGGYNCLGVVCDVRDYASQQKCVAQTIEAFGKLDVLIANAGVGHFASIEDLSPEEWQEVIDVNLTGVFYSTKASLDALKSSSGYIITIASLAGTNFFARGSAYNASKFGLVGFTQAIMLDLRHSGVKVSTIMPGSVSTYFNNHEPSEADAWKIQPEDIGQIVIDLLKMNPRTLPSKIEVRPSVPPKK